MMIVCTVFATLGNAKPVLLLDCPPGDQERERRSEEVVERACFTRVPTQGWTRSGPSRSWHANGQVRSTGNWSWNPSKAESVRDGEWTTYYVSGKAKSNGHYRYGVRVGEWQYWTEAGSTTTECLGADGRGKGCPAAPAQPAAPQPRQPEEPSTRAVLGVVPPAEKADATEPIAVVPPAEKAEETNAVVRTDGLGNQEAAYLAARSQELVESFRALLPAGGSYAVKVSHEQGLLVLTATEEGFQPRNHDDRILVYEGRVFLNVDRLNRVCTAALAWLELSMMQAPAALDGLRQTPVSGVVCALKKRDGHFMMALPDLIQGVVLQMKPAVIVGEAGAPADSLVVVDGGPRAALYVIERRLLPLPPARNIDGTPGPSASVFQFMDWGRE
jgi:hypothetical protein